MKLNPVKKAEFENFKKMSLKEKLTHIQYYYTPHILLTLLTIAFLYVMTDQLWSLKSQKTYAKLSYYDCPYNEEQTVALLSAFSESGLYDPKKQEVTVQNFLFETQIIGNSISRQFFAEVAAATLDVIIINTAQFENMLEGGYCRDLSNFNLPGDHLIYDSDGIPRGVSLAENPLFPGDYAAIIFINSRRSSNAAKLLRLMTED